MSKITMGGDPELMLVDSRGEIQSSLDFYPANNKDRKIDLNGGYTVYPDNVLFEGTLPPAEDRNEFIGHYRELFRRSSKFIEDKNLHLRAQAAHVFKPKQLKHEGAITVGCNPEFDVWELEQYTPTLVGGLRTTGGHVHLGAPYLLEPRNLIACIKLMDIFVGLPLSIIDTDPTKMERKKLYGKMGRFRSCPYGGEYRTLSSFWLHSPNTVGLVYDLANHVLKVIEDGEVEKYLPLTSEEELREALDSDNRAVALDVMHRILPNSLLNQIRETPIAFTAPLAANWAL